MNFFLTIFAGLHLLGCTVMSDPFIWNGMVDHFETKGRTREQARIRAGWYRFELLARAAVIWLLAAYVGPAP